MSSLRELDAATLVVIDEAEPAAVAELKAVADPEAEPESVATPGWPPSTERGFLDRSRMRRRIRYLQRLKELQLRDIGGFEVELHRYSRQRPEVVQAKIESAVQTDHELRTLQRLLNRRPSVSQLRVPGIGGVCPGCGTVHGSSDRFCAWCGDALGAPIEAETPSGESEPPRAS